MARNDVVVSNVRIPKKLHEQLREQAALHSLSFDGELIARLQNSFSYEHWQEQRDRLLDSREPL
jgi:Arc-like DNA binding domain